MKSRRRTWRNEAGDELLRDKLSVHLRVGIVNTPKDRLQDMQIVLSWEEGRVKWRQRKKIINKTAWDLNRYFWIKKGIPPYLSMMLNSNGESSAGIPMSLQAGLTWFGEWAGTISVRPSFPAEAWVRATTATSPIKTKESTFILVYVYLVVVLLFVPLFSFSHLELHTMFFLSYLTDKEFSTQFSLLSLPIVWKE